MEFKEIKKKSETELHKVLIEYRDKLRELRFKDANKQLKNVKEIKKTRVVIAQVLTLLKVNRVKNADIKTEKKK